MGEDDLTVTVKDVYNNDYKVSVIVKNNQPISGNSDIPIEITTNAKSEISRTDNITYTLNRALDSNKYEKFTLNFDFYDQNNAQSTYTLVSTTGTLSNNKYTFNASKLYSYVEDKISNGRTPSKLKLYAIVSNSKEQKKITDITNYVELIDLEK